jgi:hypothetical protein
MSLACPDWERWLKERRLLIPEDARGINDVEAARAVGIFDRMRLPDGWVCRRWSGRAPRGVAREATIQTPVV